MFEKRQSERIASLSRQNLDRQLEIVIDERIRATPTIESELGDKLRFPVRLSSDDTEILGKHFEVVAESAATNSITALNQLRQIGIAFHNFHAAYQTLPGIKNFREGKRGIGGEAPYPFSWRVALLPFLEHQALFEQYRFDEPWDSEHNSKLLDKMPAVYRSPFAPADQPPGETNFLGFATEQGALGTDRRYKFETFTDGLSNTILVVETKTSVPWTVPQDLTNTEFKLFPEQPLRCLISDGSVYSMWPIDQTLLEKIITRNGREVVPILRQH